MEQRVMPHHKIVFVCTNERAPGERICCHAGSGALLRDKLKAMVKERRLRGRVRVSASGCLDRCEDGPNIMIFPDNIWYAGVREDDLETILDNLVESLRREGALPEHYLDS